MLLIEKQVGLDLPNSFLEPGAFGYFQDEPLSHLTQCQPNGLTRPESMRIAALCVITCQKLAYLGVRTAAISAHFTLGAATH